ncbi:MAG: hypothetical protein ABSB75_02210 [Candidatus Limnocylindrales bacterium]
MMIDVVEGAAATSTHVEFVAGSTVSNLPSGRSIHCPAAIPSDQLYYWTMAWQRGEAESAADRAAGRTKRFESPSEAIHWLLSCD